MNVTFLGTGGSISSDGLNNTSILVKGSDEASVLIDASSNLYIPLSEETDVIFLTHEHIDHIYGLPSFIHQSWLKKRKKPLYIYALGKTLDLAENLISSFALREKGGMFDIFVKKASDISLGNLRIRIFKTNHTDSSYGLIIGENGKTLVYTSDTRPDADISISRADVLITEASGLFEGEDVLVKKGHQSGKDAKALAEKLGVKCLYLVHLPEDKGERERIREESVFGIIPVEKETFAL